MLLMEGHNNPQIPKMRVLVICTGNSARSIMAEALFNTVGGSLFQAYSAGSRATGKVNPLALEQISQLDVPDTTALRSKNWDEFTQPDAPELDLVLSVCDSAASEPCPVFTGDYERLHWSFPDPAGSSDDLEEERANFARCFNDLKARIESLTTMLSSSNSKATLCKAMRSLSP